MIINYNNKSAFEFSQSIYKTVMSDCKDYFQGIGVKTFSFFRLYQGGQYFFFSSEPDLSEKVNFLIHENSTILTKRLKSIPEGQYHFGIDPMDTNDPVIKLLYSLGWKNYFNFYFRDQNFIEAISIAPGSRHSSYFEFFSNNTPLLKNLYWLVRDKMDDLVPYEQPGVLSHFYKGADISYQPLVDPIHLPSMNEKLRSMLDDLSRKKLALTQREWEVCKGLVRGETSKETARILNIRHRTVEDYLASMYQKFSAKLGYKPSRSQTIQYLHQLLDKDFITQTIWDPTLPKQDFMTRMQKNDFI